MYLMGILYISFQVSTRILIILMPVTVLNSYIKNSYIKFLYQNWPEEFLVSLIHCTLSCVPHHKQVLRSIEPLELYGTTSSSFPTFIIAWI